MGREKQQEDAENGNVSGNGGLPYVKVMTDDQLETLRKQIAVYAIICEQLVEMHKNLITRDPQGAGLMTYAGHKILVREQWSPTPVQLQILERLFDQGIGTPSKQKCKEIASVLSQHGQTSETNVHNWIQNRRTSTERKQQT